jgi:hypothetical protein
METLFYPIYICGCLRFWAFPSVVFFYKLSNKIYQTSSSNNAFAIITIFTQKTLLQVGLSTPTPLPQKKRDAGFPLLSLTQFIADITYTLSNSPTKKSTPVCLWQVPFHPNHPENQGIFHNQNAKPLCKGGFNSPLHKGFTHIIEKNEIYLKQTNQHLSAARQVIRVQHLHTKKIRANPFNPFNPCSFSTPPPKNQPLSAPRQVPLQHTSKKNPRQYAARQVPFHHTIPKNPRKSIQSIQSAPVCHQAGSISTPHQKSAQIRHIRAPPRGVRVPTSLTSPTEIPTQTLYF